METTADVFHYPVRRTEPQARDERAIVRGRKRTATALIAFMLVLGVVLVAWLGPDILPIYVAPLPFAFLLIWLGADVLRADERQVERQH